ncbi:uncharacterized protein PHALS_08882 [Plasmopara halstedii]|uniref:Uncharacterized protein n=1 Tax=Plasmopara halstedii TaxID=4781 RepID=A0A0P1AEP8_PLAHL|nr:uncharacterized protein PHALS_08882 [Plasmopara halstedii]CEG38831.1 hypothetical protein PHALS_08882 [Plasmopara halstedii]|eukprot:XP_024575200.1 hypothetical protein PHALS_08882 [Plasmopara halstedii]
MAALESRSSASDCRRILIALYRCSDPAASAHSGRRSYVHRMHRFSASSMLCLKQKAMTTSRI